MTWGNRRGMFSEQLSWSTGAEWKYLASPSMKAELMVRLELEEVQQEMETH